MSSDVVDLPGLASQLGMRLGIGDFGGGLLMTLILLLLFLFPTLYFCRKFNVSAMILSIIVAFTTLCFSVAIGWMNYWVLLVVVLITALMFSSVMRDWITGHGRG